MGDKQIRVDFYCPVECVSRVREAMLKAAHESLMRWHDKKGTFNGYPCEMCVNEHKDSSVCVPCMSCSAIGRGYENNYKADDYE